MTRCRVVVPLAGPDFIGKDGTVKALKDLKGVPLLRRSLESRPWAESLRPEDYSFVLLDRPETREFVQNALRHWYPSARVIFLSNYTRGAAFSALAGAAMDANDDCHLIVDLADIVYDSDLNPSVAFGKFRDTAGIAPVFDSENAAYSYLRLDENGQFVEAAEKRVISRNASAGTYLFSSTAVFLRAVAHALDNAANQTYNDLYYVCPLFNGVKAQGLNVLLHPVTNIRDIKLD